MSDYEVGYGKPPQHTKWKPGVSANPGGKTSAHRKAEVRAAEVAAKIQLDLVNALDEFLSEASKPADKVEQIRGDILKLLKDSQDRAYGTPTQPTEITNPDGSLAPTTVQIVAVKPDDDCNS